MDTIPSSRSGPSPTRRLAGRCVALAALIFLGLQGAQHAYYFQNTAHVELQLLQVEDFALVGVEVEASGRVLLTPRLAEDVLKLLSPVQRQVFWPTQGIGWIGGTMRRQICLSASAWGELGARMSEDSVT